MILVCICLYLKFHDVLKQQHVIPVTVTKGLYYCNNMGKMVEAKMGRRIWNAKGGSPYLQKCVMEKNNFFRKEKHIINEDHPNT